MFYVTLSEETQLAIIRKIWRRDSGFFDQIRKSGVQILYYVRLSLFTQSHVKHVSRPQSNPGFVLRTCVPRVVNLWWPGSAPAPWFCLSDKSCTSDAKVVPYILQLRADPIISGTHFAMLPMYSRPSRISIHRNLFLHLPSEFLFLKTRFRFFSTTPPAFIPFLPVL